MITRKESETDLIVLFAAGRMQSRLPRPQDQLDGEFVNSRVNMEALKKGTFVSEIREKIRTTSYG